MARLVRLFVDNGVRKVRLTGGEPLTRGGVAGLAAAIAAMPGLSDLSLSTNGTRLARHARSLREAGVRRLNVSLDTLDAAGFQAITGRDCLADVLDGLRAAREAGFAPVKLNSVVHAATPEDDVERLLAYAREQGFVLRLIEPMPMGDCGRAHEHVDLNALGGRLAARHGLVPALAAGGAGPARYWTADGQTHVLGVITPMSRHFCAACNRVRLGADGTLYLCLGQEDQVPLGRMLRAGASDAELRGALLAGIAAKPERHDFNARPSACCASWRRREAEMRDIERFIDGFQRFQYQYYEAAPSLYRNLRDGQHPSTLLIGCCDSRVDPAMLLGCDPGDIFTVRNVANLVPPADRDQGHHGVLAAIQFAVDQLKVGRIIVLGHAHCGGIRALMEARRRGRRAGLPEPLDGYRRAGPPARAEPDAGRPGRRAPARLRTGLHPDLAAQPGVAALRAAGAGGRHADPAWLVFRPGGGRFAGILAARGRLPAHRLPLFTELA